MKILMVLNYYFPYISGLSEYCRRISEELVKKGHQVTVVTSQHDRKLPKKEKVNGVDVIRCPFLLRAGKGLLSLSFIMTAVKEARRHDVVNLHLPMLEAGLLQLLIARKSIITYHCDLRLGKGPIDRIIQKVYYTSAAAALRKARRIITYTKDYTKNSRLLQHYLKKCDYVNPVVDAGHFKPVAGAAARFKRLNSLEGKKIVGFAGRFVHEKGLPYLLRAIPPILAEVPNAAFVFAGEHAKVAGGSIMDEIKDLIDKHRKNIVLLGNVPYEKLPEFYSACDVLALPSIDPLEAFGIVQIEAMLCKTPVVAANLPGVRVPVQKTGMGILIKPKDVTGLATAIVRIIKDRKKYVKNRSMIIRNFGATQAVDSYVKMLGDGNDN